MNRLLGKLLYGKQRLNTISSNQLIEPLKLNEGKYSRRWLDARRRPLNIVIEAASAKVYLAAYTIPKKFWFFGKKSPLQVASLRIEYNDSLIPLTANLTSIAVQEAYQNAGIADYLIALAKKVASEAHQIQIAVSATSDSSSWISPTEKGKWLLAQAHQKSYYFYPVPYVPVEPLKSTDDSSNMPLLNLDELRFYVNLLDDSSVKIAAYLREKSPDNSSNVEPIGTLLVSCNYPFSYKFSERIFYFEELLVRDSYQNCDIEINLMLIGEEIARRLGGIAVEVDPQKFGFEWLGYLQSFRKWQVQPDERFCKRFPV